MPYVTVHLMKSLPKIPYIRIYAGCRYVVLANPMHLCTYLHAWHWRGMVAGSTKSKQISPSCLPFHFHSHQFNLDHIGSCKKHAQGASLFFLSCGRVGYEHVGLFRFDYRRPTSEAYSRSRRMRDDWTPTHFPFQSRVIVG